MTQVNGEEIKWRRERLKLSQSAAARAAGWSAQRWSDFENNRYPNPKLNTLDAIAGVLGCRIEQIIKQPPRRIPSR